MGVETLLGILLYIVVVCCIAWIAHYVITGFFPEPVRTPALLIVGVILLIVIIMFLLHGGPVSFPLRR